MITRLAKIKHPRRNFSITQVCRNNGNKDEDKDLLKKLGSILQRGKVGSESAGKGNHRKLKTRLEEKPKEMTQYQKESLALELVVREHLPELEKSYQKLAFMTRDDIRIQENLALGAQFGAAPSGHYLDRAAIIQTLPNEVDLLNTPWDEIQRIYGALEQLDQDKSLASKVLKKYRIDERDLKTRLKVGKNVDGVCRSGRRKENYEVPRLFDRMFNHLHPFNIVGFDRSISGAPLLSGKHSIRRDSKQRIRDEIPVELMQDIRPFNTKVSIMKRDANFMDEDLLKECISPHDPKPLAAKDALSGIGKPIFVDRVNNYQKLETPQLRELVDLIDREISTLRDSLSTEIAREMFPLNNVIPISINELKTNHYVLTLKEHAATAYSGPALSYHYKLFHLIPVYGFFLHKRNQLNCLYRHLFKVMILNLEDHCRQLMKIKYKLPEESKMFMNRIKGKIHRALTEKIMSRILEERIRFSTMNDAIIWKPFLKTDFSRIYWIKPLQKSGSNRRGSAYGRKRSMVLRKYHFPAYLNMVFGALYRTVE